MIDKLLFLLLGAFDVADHGSGQGDPLSPRDMYRSSARIDGQPVSAAGYSANGRCLYQSRSRYRQFISELRRNADDFDPASYDEDGVTLIGPSLTNEAIRLISGKNLIVRGTFVANYLVDGVLDFRACGRAAILIREEDMRRILASLRRSARPRPQPARAAQLNRLRQ